MERKLISVIKGIMKIDKFDAIKATKKQLCTIDLSLKEIYVIGQ